MSKRKITRIQFFAIKRELVSTHRRQEDIAADHHVGSSTVSIINRAGTWENYVANVWALKPLRNRVSASDPVVRKDKAAKAGLKPQERVDRATEKLSAELKKLEDTPTRDEFKSSNSILSDRLNGTYRRIVALEGVNRNQGVALIVLFFLFLIVTVIAVVK